MNKHYKGSLFFEWHGKLTGSCKQGRESFIKDNDIDLEKFYSIDEFLNICKNEYGKEIILRIIDKKENL